MSVWRLEVDQDDRKCHVYENGVERHDVVSIAVTKEIGQNPRLWLTLTPETIIIDGDMIQMPTKVRQVRDRGQD